MGRVRLRRDLQRHAQQSALQADSGAARPDPPNTGQPPQPQQSTRTDDIPEWLLQESRAMTVDRETLWTHFAMTEILAHGCPPLAVSERVADDGTCGWRSLAASLNPHQQWTAIRTTTLQALDEAARQAQRWRITASRCAAQAELQVQRCDMTLADTDEQLSEHLNQELAGYHASTTKHATLMIMAVAAWLHHHNLVCIVPAAVDGDRSAVVHTREWLRKEDLKQRFDNSGVAQTWPAVHVALINARNPSSSGSLNHYVPLRPLGDVSATGRQPAGLGVARERGASAAAGRGGADGGPARADSNDAANQRDGDTDNPDNSAAPRAGRQDTTVRPPAQPEPVTIAPRRASPTVQGVDCGDAPISDDERELCAIADAAKSRQRDPAPPTVAIGDSPRTVAYRRELNQRLQRPEDREDMLASTPEPQPPKTPRRERGQRGTFIPPPSDTGMPPELLERIRQHRKRSAPTPPRAAGGSALAPRVGPNAGVLERGTSDAVQPQSSAGTASTGPERRNKSRRESARLRHRSLSPRSGSSSSHRRSRSRSQPRLQVTERGHRAARRHASSRGSSRERGSKRLRSREPRPGQPRS